MLQDDDYLVHSEIIEALHARLDRPEAPNAIHLLPPHEHLSTSLREIHVPAPDTSHLSDIHTSFAWLGHGMMMKRAEAQNFLNLLRLIKAAPDEMKMADNFFTLLSNRVPEVWFDQGFELGGGQPFTAGSEGDERNKNFTVSSIHSGACYSRLIDIQLRATRYLESLAHCGQASCEGPTSADQQRKPRLPYTTLDHSYQPTSWIHSACRGPACVLDTNIRILPEEVSHTANNISDILALEAKNIEVLGDSGKENYLQHSPSNAVDMKPDTVFRSLTRTCLRSASSAPGCRIAE